MRIFLYTLFVIALSAPGYAASDCAAGQYFMNEACVTCLDNFTSDAGATGLVECYINCDDGTRAYWPNTCDPTQCARGGWISNDVCTPCAGNGIIPSNALVYCPGDNMRYTCPQPTRYADMAVSLWYNGDPTPYMQAHATATGCRTNFHFESDIAQGSFSCALSPADGDYGTNPDAKGYCLSQANYDNAKCAAKYYHPGSIRTNTAAEIIETFCIPVGDGYWSPADSHTRTQCPDGYRDGPGTDDINNCIGNHLKYGTRTDGETPNGCAAVDTWHECELQPCTYTKTYSGNIISDCTPSDCTNTPASVSAMPGYSVRENGTECAQLCTAGFTKLRISNGLSIPVYAQRHTSPTIVIRSPNNTQCYINLASDRASDTINIQTPTATYHTIR